MTADLRRSGIQAAYGRYVASLRWVVARSVQPPPPPATFSAPEVRRALLVCTGLIGDTLMCLPAISSARALLPNAEITILGTHTNLPLFRLAGCADVLVATRGAPLGLSAAAAAERRAVASRLSGRGFDLAVVFLGDDYAPLLARAAVPHRILVRRQPFERLATAVYDIGAARTWGPGERLGAWRALGLVPAPPLRTLQVPQDVIDGVSRRLGLSPHGFVAVHPFGRTSDQRWPVHLARECMDLVEAQQRIAALVVGVYPDSHSRVEDARFRLVGQLTLEELAAVLELAAGVISTDSGPLHLAGVLKRPGVGLFRASRPEHAARYPGLHPIVAPAVEECVGCAWDRCRHSPCRQLASIPPAVVAARLSQVLEGSRT